MKISQIMDKDGTKNKWLKAIILKGKPKENSLYELKEIDEQTDNQRKLFNPMVRLYYNSACHCQNVSNWHKLRKNIKRRLGCGYETIRFCTYDLKMRELPYKRKDEIPEDVQEDYRNGNIERVQLILKSMADYSKKEMTIIIDSLIKEMLQNQVLESGEGKKFNEILEEIGFTE